MKKQTFLTMLIIISIVLMFSCKKTSNDSESVSGTYSNSVFIGTWSISSEYTYASDYFYGSTPDITQNDTTYAIGNQTTLIFTGNDSVVDRNPYDTATLPYKVLNSNHIVIDFSAIADTVNNIYLIDTFNYRISGSSLTLWYNREVKYVTVPFGWNPVSVIYSDSTYPLNYDVSDTTPHSLEAGTLNLVKQ